MTVEIYSQKVLYTGLDKIYFNVSLGSNTKHMIKAIYIPNDLQNKTRVTA